MDIEQTISLYLDGELSSEAEAELHHTLAISPEARTLFRQHLSLHKAARDERSLVQPEPAMRSALFARLVDEEGMSPAVAKGESPSSSVHPAGPGAAAADLMSSGTDGVGQPHAADGDRGPVSPDVRRDERRRKRRLIPILIPIVLIMIAGSALLYDDGIFFPDDPRRDATTTIALNQQDSPMQRSLTRTESADPTESETAGDSGASPSDETVSQPDAPSDGSNPSLGATVARDRTPSRTRSTAREAEGDGIQRQHEIVANGLGGAAAPRDRVIVDRNGDGVIALSDTFGGNDLSEADNLEVNAAESPEPDEHLPNTELNVRPALRSNASIAATSPASDGTVEHAAPAFRAYGTDTEESAPVTRDNWTEFLNELELQGISINPDGSVDMIGQTALGGRGFGNDGIEYRNDSVFLMNSIGAADGARSPEVLALSAADYVQLGGQEGLQRARNGRGVFNRQNQDNENTHNVATSASIATAHSNATSSENGQSNPNATADSITPNRLKTSAQLAKSDKGPMNERPTENRDAPDLAATSSVTTNDSPMDPIAADKAPRYFVGVEGAFGGTLDRSAATLGNRTLPRLNASITDRIDGRLTAGIVLSNASTMHRAFVVVGASPFAERTVESSYNQTVQSGSIVEQISVVDPSTGSATSSFTIVRNQSTATHSNSTNERIEMSVEPWAGAGYRIDVRVGDSYSVGLEATGGIGTEFVHAGVSMPLGVAAGRTIHIELKPNVRYYSQHSAPEQPTPGSPLGTSGSTRLSGPDDDSRLSAGFGIGFVLFID